MGCRKVHKNLDGTRAPLAGVGGLGPAPVPVPRDGVPVDAVPPRDVREVRLGAALLHHVHLSDQVSLHIALPCLCTVERKAVGQNGESMLARSVGFHW